MTIQEALVIALAVFVFFTGLVVHRVGSTLKNRWLGKQGLKPKQLLTGNEVHFYHLLQKAVGPQWVVFPQVSMGALMDTTLQPAHPRFWDARSEFAAKICDFVVCDAKSLKPHLVVELDDRMHDFGKDAGRDKLMARAGYRTVRFWSRNKPSLEELRSKMIARLSA